MRNDVLFNKRSQTVRPDETLKVTALIYLTEALINEEFEQCAELIRAAKRFGATQGEISGAIAEHIRGFKILPQNEIKQIGEGFKRF